MSASHLSFFSVLVFSLVVSNSACSAPPVSASSNAASATSAQAKNGPSTEDIEAAASKKPPSQDLIQVCADWLGKLPDKKTLAKGAIEDNLKICKAAQQLPECHSHNNIPIVHFDRKGARENPEKILVFGLIHGDEYPSGAVARAWTERLLEIDPRNEWRLIPILNPDGMKNRTRVNGRGVDINRNFPSEDWNTLAEKYWKTKTNSDPRRAPGPTANSEIETQCAIKHIEEFKPDLIISIHTPYGVLDFDGPKLSFPEFQGLPWVSLGTFPGSLGRYMWTDRKVPVLTIELKHDLKSALQNFDELQDISGQVALKIRRQQPHSQVQ